MLSAALALVGASNSIAQFKGQVELGKNKAAVANWTYDTGNGADGSFLDPTIAQQLGLGTWDAKAGVFTAPKGTVTANFNNNLLSTYCFTDVMVSAVDSKGNNCVVKQTVYVIQNRDGDAMGVGKQNSVLENLNVLNAGWINDAKAGLFGAGAKATGRWPVDPAKVGIIIKAQDATALADAQTGTIQQIFNPTVMTGTGSTGVGMLFSSASNYTFLTRSQAAALGLTVTGSIDLAATDPQSLAALMLSDQDQVNQTIFDTAVINAIDLFGTSNPDDLLRSASGQVLILDDENSAFGILGADFVGSLGQQIAYFTRTSPTGTDQFLLIIPEPASLVLMLIGGAGLGFRRMSTRRARRRETVVA